MNLRIKRTLPAHVPAIIHLMREFAEYENMLDYLEVSEEKLHAAMFGESGFVECLVAFDNETPIAFAIFFPFFASFRGEKSVYLEDIFITEKYRKLGIGEMMLRKVARIGKDFGAVRMDFQVSDWNKTAINFYKKYGAESNDGERHFKFSGDSFLRLSVY